LIRAKNGECAKHWNTNGAKHHTIVFQAQLESTSQRQWPFGPLGGLAGHGGGGPPRTAIAPGLSLAVAWKHATSVPRVPHAKNREEHRLSPCINREPSPSTQHTQPHQALLHYLFPSCSFTLFSCFRARQRYLGELGSLEEDILGYE
jgi:hypothetical protein